MTRILAKVALMTTTFTLQTPRDYLLHRDVCSYGYFLLSPSHWEPSDFSFRTTLGLSCSDPEHRDADSPSSAVTLIIRQPPARGGSGPANPARVKPGSALTIDTDRALTSDEQARAAALLTRMLRLDESHRDIAAFHALDPRWAGNKKSRAHVRRVSKHPLPEGGGRGWVGPWPGSGRGRLMRSPTFFEDVIKTVTSCNVTWPSTIIMNEKLCRVFGARSASGHSAFPTPERLAAARPATLRARCSVGYRDQRIVELARIFAREAAASGSAALPTGAGRAASSRTGQENRSTIDCPLEQRLSALADDELFETLQDWPGIGPYAAANIMQLMGRYSRLPLDTESVRHGRTVLGMKGTSASIMKRLHRHFAPFKDHSFRAYWFELWDFYESKRGPAWTWERQTTGKSFTAAHFEREAAAASGSLPPGEMSPAGRQRGRVRGAGRAPAARPRPPAPSVRKATAVSSKRARRA